MAKSTAAERVVTVKQAIDSFLLSCKVEGRSYGTIECYTDKLKGSLWYANTQGWQRGDSVHQAAQQDRHPCTSAPTLAYL
jgi:hypothetical protein